MNYIIEIRWLPAVLFLAFAILFSSCALLKHTGMRPADGPCAETYDSALIGEQESIAGTILMPLGVAIITGGAVPWGYREAVLNGQDESLSPEVEKMSLSFMIIGSAVVGAGIIVMADGHVRVNAWERYCAGTTPAAKYCLFEGAEKKLSAGETLP